MHVQSRPNVSLRRRSLPRNEVRDRLGSSGSASVRRRRLSYESDSGRQKLVRTRVFHTEKALENSESGEEHDIGKEKE